MVISIPLPKRPLYQGIFGAIFGVASVAGPLIGGVFTTNVSWRWCFYINLPIGAAVVAVLLFILQTPPSKNTDSVKTQIRKLDPYGSAVFLPGIICLLLALQWGGTTYVWSNWRIIFLFILAFVLIAIFITIQFRSGDYATVPIRIITQRSVASGVFFSAVSPGSMMIVIYFLPLWFQAIKGVSAVHSGIDTLPLVLSLVVSSIIAGQLTHRTGYYVPQLYACTIIMSVGAGLLTTLQVDTGHAKWIGYQVVFGFGLGLGMQQASMGVQACLPKKDVMIGVSLMFFMQGLGGSIFLSIGQTVFNHSLVSELAKQPGIPNIPQAAILNTGATDLRNLVPAEYLEPVLLAYNKALMDVLKVAVACAAATVFSSLTMEWKDVRGLKQGGAEGEAQKAKDLEKKAEAAGESPPVTAVAPQPQVEKS
jgi:MFS family permease